MTDLLEPALTWYAVGCSPIPVADDGTKRPAFMWKRYQKERADDDQLMLWFSGNTRYGLGIVTGAVSNNLEMLEFEGRAVVEGYIEKMRVAMEDHGQSELWAILGGYAEWTPSGGLHLYYFVDGEARGNTKLARRPSTPEELAAAPKTKFQVLIETRGEGGYVVAAPTPAKFHTTGRGWTVMRGTPETIPTITAEQRDTLHAIASTLDAMPVHDQAPIPAAPTGELAKLGLTNGGATGTGLRPGDDYNNKASWDDILEGWTRVRRFGHGYGWCRPDKAHGISATTGTSADGADRLYVFSSSTDFETEIPYSKFAAYARLHHNDNYSEAAKELRRLGYGDQTPPPISTPIATDLPPGGGIPDPSPTAGEPSPAPTGSLLDKPAPTGSLLDEPAPAGDASDASVASEPTGPSLFAEAAAQAAAPAPTERQTDDGNANALIALYGKEIHYCHERGRWLTWATHRWAWQPSGGGEAREYVKDTARQLPTTADWKQWRNRSLSAVGTTNTLIQAATDKRVVVPIADLDAEPWSLNTPAGVVDLRTGEIGDLANHALHTRSTLCAPDHDANRSVWLDFLATTFEGDQELIAYMQRMVGYSATGYIGPHVLPFAWGSGGNGKGVFLEAVGKVLGDYFTTTGNGFLMSKEFTGHETEIARLAGARMVLCSEVNETDRFDEARVKQLTGGDTLTARFMRQDHFTFEPTHHLWLMGNHKPSVISGGRSFWRRCRLIPFLHEVPKDQEVDDLQGILAREHGPAILSWIIDGAVEFARAGLREPRSVTQATEEYARDQDTVARFIEDMCSRSDTDVLRVEVSVLAAAYARWCDETGEAPVSGKRLSMDLANRFNVRSARDNRRRWYVGIGLNDTTPAWQRGTGSVTGQADPTSPTSW